MPRYEDRAKNPENYPYIKNRDGSVSTHRMAAEVDESGNWYAFPTIVQADDGSLIEFEDSFKAMRYNLDRGNFKSFGKDKDAAIKYAQGGYKTKKLKNFNPSLLR